LVPQTPGFLQGELEHEVAGEALDVSFHRPDQGLGLDAVEGGDVRVQNHLLAPEEEDRLLDPLRRYQRMRVFHHRGLLKKRLL